MSSQEPEKKSPSDSRRRKSRSRDRRRRSKSSSESGSSSSESSSSSGSSSSSSRSRSRSKDRHQTKRQKQIESAPSNTTTPFGELPLSTPTSGPVPYCPNRLNRYHTCVRWCEAFWKPDTHVEASDKNQALPCVEAAFLPRFKVSSLKGGGPGVIKGVGEAGLQGRRPSMEDTTCIVESFTVQNNRDAQGPLCFVSVFDGHCGKSASLYAKRAVLAHFKSELQKGVDVSGSLGYSFLKSHENYVTDGAGTCALVCVICKFSGRVWVANAGDSRALLCRRGVAVALSRDHKPSDPDEKRRIEEAGGEVMVDRNTSYVKYPKMDTRMGLSVSRSIGDGHFNIDGQLIIPKPEISREVVDPANDSFIVLCCDGVYDVMSSEEVVSAVREAIDGIINPQLAKPHQATEQGGKNKKKTDKNKNNTKEPSTTKTTTTSSATSTTATTTTTATTGVSTSSNPAAPPTVQRALTETELNKVCTIVAETAIQKGSGDNITVVLVKF